MKKIFGARAEEVAQVLTRKGYIRPIGRRIDLTHTFNGKFRRLSWSQPSPTVDTKFGEVRLFLHPDEDRSFTVREAARLQGFPDSFVFMGAPKEQFRLVGNAVPPPMGRSIGKLIRSLLGVSPREGKDNQ